MPALPLPRLTPWRALILGLALGLLAAGLAGWPAPVEADDLSQTRLDVAPPAPLPGAPLVQSFTPRHDGLLAVELILVRYDDRPIGRFSLTLEGPDGATVAAREWDGAKLTHNQVLRWEFAPQARSAGRTYRLWLRGDADNRVSAWGSRLDVLAGGALSGGGEAADLRLVTRYRLGPAGALDALSGLLGEHGPTLLLALALLPLPGVLALLAWRPAPAWDVGAWLGVALALGLAVWPLLWIGLTLVGGRWTAGALWACLSGGWAIAAILAWRRRPVWRASPPYAAALLLILLAGLAVRFLAVRDLAFPPWVDASRHGLIVTLMRESGRFPADYRPLLAVDRAPYHFGFHAAAASVGLLRGGPVAGLLLALGQLLNALVPLTVYAGAWLVSRRRGAALLAAFLTALPFFFPAYYLTWGRYTQLTGMVLWPVLLALTWQLVRGARGWRRTWPLVGLLAAGIFTIHFRLFLLYLPFAALVWALSRFRGTRALAGAALLGTLLAVPRLVQLAGLMRGVRLASPIPDYNAVPLGYLEAGWEPGFYAAGGLALLWAAAAALRGRRWGWWPLALAAWMGGCLILLTGRVPGVPVSWLINVNSVLITLFVPLALALAAALGRVERWLGRRGPAGRRPALRLAAAALGAALALALLFGARQQIGIVNETTILARPADAAALRWLDGALPADALVAVNAWRWLEPAWAAADGGAWITPLTGRVTTTPPVDYIYDPRLAAEVAAFNEAAMAVEDWAAPAAAAWLRRWGVTHVYVGPRGGFFDPAALAANPRLTVLYAADGAFVFAVGEESTGRVPLERRARPT